MAIDRKLPPGSVKVLSSEERWKQYSRDGSFGGESGGIQDESTKAREGGKNKAVGGKPKVGAASGAGTGNSLIKVGGAAGSGTAGAPGATPEGLLPTSDGGPVSGDLTHEAGLAAGTLPITNRAVTVAGSDDLKALATPLSEAVDKLSDHLASGTIDEATLKTDVADYKAAMDAAGHGDDTALGLSVMAQAAHLPEASLTTLGTAAKAADITLPTTDATTLDEAKAKLTALLADPKADAGVVDLSVMQVKNKSTEAGGDASASDIIDAATAATDADAPNNLAALYAAAAKNGVNLSEDSEDKVGKAKNKAVTGKLDRDTKAAIQKQQEASQEASRAAQQNSGGGGTGGTSGTGGGGGGSGNTIQAPTYDAAAAATPHGAKEDLSKWTQQVYEKGKFNNEQQHYTNNGQNIKFGADGSATITAHNEGNGNWSSARITGSPIGKLPAYIEATMQNPSGQGTWPAFWAVGQGSWPQGGEIDVMENVNGNDELHTSNHWGSGAVGAAGEMPAWSPTDTIKGIDMTQPHRYGVMITDTGTQFYLDGKKIGNPVTYPPEANFPKIASEMVPTINLAMGGTWPGQVPNDLPDQTLKVLGMTRSNTAPDEGGST